MLFEEDYGSMERTFENSLMVWRGMLALVQFEQFMNFDWSEVLERIIKVLHLSLADLRANQNEKILIEYVSLCIPRAALGNFVLRLQNYMTIYMVSQRWKHSFEQAIMVLDVLQNGNNKKPYRERVPYKEFYNDAVNKDLDINKDFNIWIKERERCRKASVSFDKFRVFTICSFPWILDSAFKAEILKHANRINQDREALSINPMDLLSMGRAGMHLMFEVKRSSILDDALNVI